MKKKKKLNIRVVVFSVIGFIMFSGLVFAYFYFQPKEAALVTNDVIATNTTTLNYANAQDHFKADGNPHYVWACSMNDNDCVYVRDYVIQPLSKQQDEGINDFGYIEFVDFNEAPDNLHYRSTNWGFNYYPAFLKIQNIDGQLEILSVMDWNKADPFTSDELKQWMYDNGIWHSYFKVEEKIDQAITN